MILGLVILSVFAAACLAVPIQSYDDVPAEYKVFLSQAKEYLNSLTEDDEKVLKDIAIDYAKYKNEDEVLAALKEKSASLYAKGEKLRVMLNEKIDALGDEANAFAKEVLWEARKIQAAVVTGNKPSVEELEVKIQSVVEKYNALSESAKADLEEQFYIASIFKNENVQDIAKQMLAMN